MRLLFFLLCSICTLAVHAQNQDAIDAYMMKRLQADSIPGASLLITHKGKAVKAANYGYANLEWMVPASQQTVYELASVSKPITATAIMLLAEQGKLSIDSSIGKYIDNVPDMYKGVTIRHLLSHIAGLPSDHYVYTKLYAPTPLRYKVEDQLADLFKLKPEGKPGEKFLYSNAGFFVQAAIIQKVTGGSYQQFIQTKIFDKAGMRQSYFINGDSVVKNHAQGYTKRKGKLVRFSLEGTIQALDANGFGGLMSTTGDLQLFVEALLAGKLVQKQTLSQMLQPVLLANNNPVLTRGGVAGMGLGWQLKNIGGLPAVFHNGHTGTAVVCFPQQELVVILLTNLSAGYSIFGDKGFKVGEAGFELAGMAVQQYIPK